MAIIQSIMTNNPCYKAGAKIKVNGIMLHSVGCPQPNASVFIRQWNVSTYTRACVHGFIDGTSGITYQTLPWDMRGWHCGGSGNNNYIGIEMCEPSSIKYTSGNKFLVSNADTAKAVAIRTYEGAVETFAELCRQFNLNPLGKNVIISHAEGYKLGKASNHGDPEHLWKGLGLSYTMNTFRQDVYNKLHGVYIQNVISTPVGDSITSSKVLQVGSRVRVKKGAKTYTGGRLSSFVYDRDHIVKSITGDRVVITYNNVVIAAIRETDLTIV